MTACDGLSRVYRPNGWDAGDRDLEPLRAATARSLRDRSAASSRRVLWDSVLPDLERGISTSLRFNVLDTDGARTG